MSILDRAGRAFSRQQNTGADPAHAFGSQEQIMEEFQRQSYVPPESVPHRAAAVLSSLRERIARPQRQYETDAPTYSAETYDQPAAPDLGWDAAFDPDARQAEAAPPAPSAQERFQAFPASPPPRPRSIHMRSLFMKSWISPAGKALPSPGCRRPLPWRMPFIPKGLSPARNTVRSSLCLQRLPGSRVPSPVTSSISSGPCPSSPAQP